MNDNPDFLNNVMNACEEMPDGIAVLIAVAFNEQLYTVAEHIFKSGLKQAQGQWKEINELTRNVLSRCKDYKELESIEYFRDNLLPLVKDIEDEMVQDEIDGWEQEIEEYISEVEKHSPKYAYTRRYAWRAKYKDVEDCPLSPENYESEATFLSKVKERKVEWRRSFFRTNNHGVNPNDYENLEDFREAVDKAILAEREELENDKTIYTYLGVVFDDNKVYNYRTTDSTINIGDTVVVPVGVKKSNKHATVVSIGQYTRLAAPYPVEKTKEIIGKADIITAEESGVWIPYQDEKEKTSLIKSEEYKEQIRISIYSPGEFAPYEIICGIYGEMFHSVFGNTLEEITEKYEGMKIDLQKYIDSGKKDDDFCSNFVDKW